MRYKTRLPLEVLLILLIIVNLLLHDWNAVWWSVAGLVLLIIWKIGKAAFNSRRNSKQADKPPYYQPSQPLQYQSPPPADSSPYPYEQPPQQ